MLVKLRESGCLLAGKREGDTPVLIERRAMLVYAGEFDSMDGKVKMKPEHLKKLVENHNKRLETRLAAGQAEEDYSQYPPLQLDHSTSARDTVGRLMGALELGEHTTADGKKVPAVYATRLRFLGKENVEPATDGRWTHLSIGADLEKGELTELTVTPFPAAADAKMLKKGEAMPTKEQMKKHLMDHKKMAEEDADKHLAKMSDEEGKKLAAEMDEHEKKMAKASNAEDAPDSADKAKMAKASNAEDAPDSAKMKQHLMEHEKLSDKDAEEKLSKMSDEEKKELWGKRCAAEEKKLAAEGDDKKKDEDEKKETKAKKLSRLSAAIASTQEAVRLKMRKATFAARLSKLRSEAKITPAEIKARFSDEELVKLAKGSDETVDAVFRSYETREPVIIPGLLGTIKATNLSELNKEARLAKLEAETRANMTLFAKGEGAKSPEGRAESVRLSAEVAPQGRSDFETICKMIDEGRGKEAKLALKKVFEAGNMDSNASNHAEVQLSGLAKEFEALQNHLNEMTQLAAE